MATKEATVTAPTFGSEALPKAKGGGRKADPMILAFVAKVAGSEIGPENATYVDLPDIKNVGQKATVLNAAHGVKGSNDGLRFAARGNRLYGFRTV